MMHLDLNLLTALAVFLHLGTTLARTVLKDNTDRAKIDRIEAGVSQVLGALSAVAAATQGPAPASTTIQGGTPHAGA